MRLENAAPDGLPLYVGYGELEVRSPDGLHHTRWLYDSEPPHGDSLNLLWLDGILFPGRYWGRGHAWSAQGLHHACFTVERFEAGHSTLYLVRPRDRHWLKIAKQASVVTLRYPELVFRSHGESRPVQTRTLTDREVWEPIPLATGPHAPP